MGAVFRQSRYAVWRASGRWVARASTREGLRRRPRSGRTSACRPARKSGYRPSRRSFRRHSGGPLRRRRPIAARLVTEACGRSGPRCWLSGALGEAAEPLRQRLGVGREFGIPDDLAVSRAGGMASLARGRVARRCRWAGRRGTNCGRNAIKKIQLGVEKVDQHRGTDDPPERHGARLL